jgi:transcription antitermination factor NusG
MDGDLLHLCQAGKATRMPSKPVHRARIVSTREVLMSNAQTVQSLTTAFDLRTPNADLALRAFPSGGPRVADRNPGLGRKWYAIYTAPRHEHAVVRHLDAYRIESFLPTWESTHVWKDGQRKRIVQPLFPSYVFARFDRAERLRVFQSPSVVTIVGNSHGSVPMQDSEIEFLRSDFCRQRVEPFHDLVAGDKVLVKCGSMQGTRGILVRQHNTLRFVVSLDLICQRVAVDVGAEELEPDLE